MSTNPRVFSRLTASSKFYDSEKFMNADKISENFIKSTINLWTNEFQANFVPPPPRPPFIEDLATDGLTSCDLCTWADADRGYSPTGKDAGTSNHMWIILLILVSFFSAIFGILLRHFITAFKYRRTNSIRAFAVRSSGSKQKQDVSTDQLCNQKQTDVRKTSIDLKFFMEESRENEGDQDIYATLDDQDSLSESDHMTSYQRGVFSKGDENEVPSAPSSAYYSDFSQAEKQYESIDHFTSFEKTDFKTGSSFITMNNVVLSNRLSAISENNFSSQNNPQTSEYV